MVGGDEFRGVAQPPSHRDTRLAILAPNDTVERRRRDDPQPDPR